MSERPDDRLTRDLQRLRDTQLDAVAWRRSRERLVKWAETRTASQADKRVRWDAALVVATVALVVAISGLVVTIRRSSSTEPASAAVIDHDAVASSATSVEAYNASWHRTNDEAAENIILDSGTLRLRVQRKAGSKRVVVRVPDGEIEDVGTVFEVVVRDKRTFSVRVDDGSVTVRLASMSPLTLRAGESWTRAGTDSPSRTQPRLAKEQKVIDSSASPAFQPSPPLDAGAEDAAYLAIIHALSAGDTIAAKQNAVAYLRGFPNGFRRDEVRRLVDE